MTDLAFFLCYLVGCALVVWGLWMAWEPLGPIGAGVALAVGVQRAWRGEKT